MGKPKTHEECNPIHLGDTDEGRVHWWWCEPHGEHVATADRAGKESIRPPAQEADHELTGLESTR